MHFRYKEYRPDGSLSARRPIIEIVLRNPYHDTSGPVIAYEALVDSGSDRNIFPAELTDLLGIDLTATENVRYVGGVVAGDRRPVYFHPVELEVGGLGGPTLTTSVGFMPDFSTVGHGLLGRRGFFDQFTFVKFRDWDNELEIGKRRH